MFVAVRFQCASIVDRLRSDGALRSVLVVELERHGVKFLVVGFHIKHLAAAVHHLHTRHFPVGIVGESLVERTLGALAFAVFNDVALAVDVAHTLQLVFFIFKTIGTCRMTLLAAAQLADALGNAPLLHIVLIETDFRAVIVPNVAGSAQNSEHADRCGNLDPFRHTRRIDGAMEGLLKLLAGAVAL